MRLFYYLIPPLDYISVEMLTFSFHSTFQSDFFIKDILQIFVLVTIAIFGFQTNYSFSRKIIDLYL